MVTKQQMHYLILFFFLGDGLLDVLVSVSLQHVGVWMSALMLTTDLHPCVWSSLANVF